jgi:hypothetical protein
MKNLGAKIQAKLDPEDIAWLHWDHKGIKLLEILGGLDGWRCCS